MPKYNFFDSLSRYRYFSPINQIYDIYTFEAGNLYQIAI